MNRHPSLRGLSDDHHTALVIAMQCKRADPESVKELWPAVVRAVSLHLEPHFDIEERHLVPALEALGEEALAARIRGDHGVLLSLAANSAASDIAVREFGQRLEQHVRFEERRVFEAVQDRLPQSVLDRIESDCRETPRSCPVELLKGVDG